MKNFLWLFSFFCLHAAHAQNPIVPNIGLNDPHIHIFNDTAYLYATHDKSNDNQSFVMEDWWIWSSPDLVNWKKESVLKPEDTYIGKSFTGCWATDAAYRNGQYFWYFSEKNQQSGVVLGPSPVGPWSDPLGKPLLDSDLTPTDEYDMAIFEENGEHYIIFGVWEFYIARLNEDMISLAEAPRRLVIHNEQGPYGKGKTDDKPYLHTYQGKYYLSWGCFYAMADNLYGPYEYVGTVIDQESFAEGYEAPTWPNGFLQGRHGSFFEWHNQWYYTYCDMSQTGNRRFRDAFISYVHYKDNGEMAKIRVDGMGVGRYDASLPHIEAEEYFKSEGWKKSEKIAGGFMVETTEEISYLNFPNVYGLDQVSRIRFSLASEDSGAFHISIHTDSLKGELLASKRFILKGPGELFQQIELELPKLKDRENLYFVFSQTNQQSLQLDHFSFDKARDYTDASLAVDQRVEDLISRMTIEEKVAQMRIFHAQLGISLNEEEELVLSDKVKTRLQYGIAGIKNPGEHIEPIQAAKLNNQLQQYIIENNRWGIPALFVTESYNGVDAEGCTKFGRPITCAASFNPDLVYRMWDVVGQEARLRGMHMCHSPEADIVRDPRFGRMSEAFGEDTYLTTQMITHAVKGVQGNYEGLGKGTHIGAVVKHFAGYGQVLGGTNFSAIEISPRTLIDEIYPPFQAAVEDAHALGIMPSHGDLNGIASHGNPALLTGVLRDQWGFQGYVVSDANDIARLNFFMNVAETPEDAAIMGLTAGVDIDLYSEEAYVLLPEIVKKRPEIIPYINRAAKRVLRTKFILGLFDDPYIDVQEVETKVRSQQALELAREADLESIILLKNENKSLPVIPDQGKKIALLGPLLDEQTQTYFEKIAGSGVSFLSEKGFSLTDEKRGVPNLAQYDQAAVPKMVKLAKKADLVILFVGGDEHTSKESFFNNALGDRATIDPVGPQDELVEKVKALGKPMIVVLKHRRTLAINTIAREADAILDCWDLSEFGDESIAKIIFGEVNPSGKSPVTIPRSIGQLPFHYSVKGINHKKGYLFMENGPLFPFGHGLSYTTFEYADLQISQPVISPKSNLEVSVVVSNTGQRTGKEVVQLYLKDEIGSVTRPDKELKAFQKIELKPGETKTVSFIITTEMLAFTGLEMCKILEAGKYTVTIGSCSATGVSGSFRLAE